MRTHDEEFMKIAGPAHELITKTPGWRGATLAKLREIIREADPTIAEDVKWKRPSNPNGSAVWEHDGVVCLGIVLKQSVRLSFVAGSSLPDPTKLFNAQLKGKSRAIDFSQDDAIDRRALIAIVKAAVAHNVAKRSAVAHNVAKRTYARTRTRRAR